VILRDASISGRSTRYTRLRRLRDQLDVERVPQRLWQHREDVIDALLAQPAALDERRTERSHLARADLVEPDEGDDDNSVTRRWNQVTHLVESAKLAVRAAAYAGEELANRRRGA